MVGRVWGQNSVRGTGSFIFAAKLKVLKEEIKKWASEEEGKIERRVSDNFKELTELDSKDAVEGLDEEDRATREAIKGEIATFMNMKKISWRQKTREKWLKEGDRNAKYFHSLANFRRKNNYVEELIMNGVSIKGSEATREGAKSYFQKLFTEEEDVRPSLEGLDFKQLREESRMGLEVPFTEGEIRGCLEECNGEKASGPDGFNLKFY